MRLAPDNAEAYADRAVANFKLGRPPEALADANRAVQLRPASFEALYNRAIIRAAAGDFLGAREDMTEVLRLAPADWPERPPAEALLAAWRARPAAP